MTSTALSAADVVPLDVSSLPTLADLGFTGGRDSFQAFCARAFQDDAPRFLRTGADELVVFRHADLRALGAMAQVENVPPGLLLPGFGQSPPDPAPLGWVMVDVLSNQLFTTNAPIHPPVRRLLLNQLSAKSAAAMEDLARQVVQSIVDEFPDHGEIDFVADVAEKLTARFWGSLLGMTQAEVVDLAISVRDLTPLFEVERSVEGVQQADAAFTRYRSLIETACQRSLAAGDSPLVAAMASELAKIDLQDDPQHAGVVPKSVGALLAGNLVDGLHTAATAAVNAVYALHRRPQVLAAVRAAPEKLLAAIFEALRLEPPVIFLQRHVFADLVYDGVLIPAGTRISMFWGAGNLDPQAFPSPLQFDLTRSHQGLTTFGGGLHICPGRFVAVMLTKVLLETLASNRVQTELVDTAYPWIGNHMMSQLRAMPLHVRRPALDLSSAD